MNFITKKIALFVGLLMVALVFVFDASDKIGFCSQYDHGCREFFDSISFSFLPFFLFLLFSLITYRMKEEVFQRWIRFAIWYIPLLIIGYFIYPQGGGLMASSFDAFVFILFISIFVITSTVKIVRAHKSSR